MLHYIVSWIDKDSKDDLKKDETQGSEEDAKKKIKEEPFEDKVKLEDGMGETSAVAEKAMAVNINEALREEMDKLMADNKRFENLVTEMHQRDHEITVRVMRLCRFLLIYHIWISLSHHFP